MDKEAKLRFHLEHIIFEDLPEGTVLNAAELTSLCERATNEQKDRAFVRGLTRVPMWTYEDSDEYKNRPKP